MPVCLNSLDSTFEKDFETLLSSKREDSVDVDSSVRDIIGAVIEFGDQALLDYTQKFDRIVLSPDKLRFSQSELKEKAAEVSDKDRRALELAAARIEAYHKKQLPENAFWTDESGVELGWRWSPVAAAGLYVPGGLASYPSSVLMNAIPAKVAGVRRLAITVPTPDNKINPLVLLAAQLSGVDEIYRIGGAQAIAALAYGTKTILPVDKITGPGNAFVAAAKRQVFGKVGIDMIAGPSEILVIADNTSRPDWVALDLLSQAEHDENAQSILITDSDDVVKEVTKQIEINLKNLSRTKIAGKSWNDNGAIIKVPNFDRAVELSNRIAPEHLELCVADPDNLAKKISHAGAIFLGHWTPEAVGDYVTGPNHVLPTARSARFSSGLSVMDFMKRTTLAKVSRDALLKIGPSAVTLADSEGLECHGLSISERMKSNSE
ncbi:MAG: histidinol dehydrogenase [Paracoccaceae bacterium]|jgi:histidinol dehydrogenase|nr:histidinol dehydrogenase [Paracoccaceae bacterium]MDG1677504.1 histidinol dehydrogenase [Paracoccaceae bacterium]MDG2248490.1 histidinol dehydrogenase [Paracoccaceae bacterium]|tara:strand:- start:95 stop:1396 length:1302 start_codon:yes stop_codon:yes gene_type:complete